MSRFATALAVGLAIGLILAPVGEGAIGARPLAAQVAGAPDTVAVVPDAAVVVTAFGDESLRNRVEAYRSSGMWRAAGEPVLSVNALPALYLARDFEPIWIGPGGGWTSGADSALAALAEAESHGLEPGDYHRVAITELARLMRRGPVSPSDAIDAEILVTDAVLLLGSHLLLGRVDPTRVEAEWIANRREANLDVRLADAVADSPAGVRGFLRSVTPSQPEYRRLRTALGQLGSARSVGGWGVIPEGGTLRVDSVDARVPAARRRLAMSTDSLERRLAVVAGRGVTTFDADLEEAVRRFQSRHGLDADGAIGARTRGFSATW